MASESFTALLSSSSLTLEEFERACFTRGIPDTHRPLAWKILLRALPVDASKREKAAAEVLSQYKLYCETAFTNPSATTAVPSIPKVAAARKTAAGSSVVASRPKLSAGSLLQADGEEGSSGTSAAILNQDSLLFGVSRSTSKPAAASGALKSLLISDEEDSKGPFGKAAGPVLFTSSSLAAASARKPSAASAGSRLAGLLSEEQQEAAEQQKAGEAGPAAASVRASSSSLFGGGEEEEKDKEGSGASSESKGEHQKGQGAADLKENDSVTKPAAEAGDAAAAVAEQSAVEQSAQLQPAGDAAAATQETEEEVLDDPLLGEERAGAGGSSKWATWHKDEELRAEIEKDVQRTAPDLHFFSQPQHLAALRRILFVYAKLNPGVRYVQGMNELLAPLWMVLAMGCEGQGPAALEQAEAETFHCFMGLMSDVRDVFIKAQDNSSSGINGLLKRLASMLERREPELATRLQRLRIEHSFYAFRWLTTLLAREFAMGDVILLWDSLFSCASAAAVTAAAAGEALRLTPALLSERDKFSFLLEVCTAMLRLQREAVLSKDFGSVMRLLQNYPCTEVMVILETAGQVRREELEEAVGWGAAAGGGGLFDLSAAGSALASTAVSISSSTGALLRNLTPAAAGHMKLVASAKEKYVSWTSGANGSGSGSVTSSSNGSASSGAAAGGSLLSPLSSLLSSASKVAAPLVSSFTSSSSASGSSEGSLNGGGSSRSGGAAGPVDFLDPLGAL